jgi:hypothetical protein
LKRKPFGLETHSLLEQDLEILESYNCISHYVPRAEYLIKKICCHWLLKKPWMPSAVSRNAHTREELSGSVFSA